MTTSRFLCRRLLSVATTLLAGVGCVVLTAPAATAGPVGAGGERVLAAGRASRTLDVAVQQSVGSLNPFLGFFATDAEIFRLVYPTLAMYDARDFSLVHGLAQSWTVSADKLTWTFRIRAAKWSDGQPITAHDAEFTFNLMMRDPDAASANGSAVANYRTVTAKDDRTLVITTRKPSATMLTNDAPIVPEHVWKNVTDIGDFKNDTFPVVGSGPFVLTGVRTDQFITLDAATNYWGDAPKFDHLVFKYYKTTDAAVQALRKGEVDVVDGITPAQFTAISDQRNITAIKAVGRRFTEITFNPGAATASGEPIGDGHPALADPRVRQAIAHAIDRQALVERTIGGFGQVGTGYIPPTFGEWHWQPSAPETMNFDIGAANRILDQAGYARGGDGVRTMPGGGRPLRFRFYAHAETATEAQTAAFITGWLRQIGIEADVQTLNGTRLNDLVNTGKFDMTFSGWGVNPDPDTILALNVCANRPNADGRGGNTDTFFCDRNYDDLYARQATELDPARRQVIVQDMQRILYTQAPVITLFYQNILEGYRSDRVEGFAQQPAGTGTIVRQQGYWGYVSATPVAAAVSAGSNTGLVVGVVAAVVVLVLAVVLLGLRRRRTADERE